jgi:hypothetical protein
LLVPHGLSPTGQVDDAQPAHGKPKAILGPDSIIIWSTMNDRRIHFSQDLCTLVTRKRTRNTYNSTHRNLRKTTT